MSESYIITSSEDEVEARLDIAGASTDQVRDYLRQIGRVPLLEAEEEVDLSKAIEVGLYASRLLMNESESGVTLSTGPLTVEEAQQLVVEGKNAHNHMMEANLRLVVSIAKRYTGKGMLFLDLIQEGNLGLARAVEKFDYTKGYKFSTYATWWIKQNITRAMADQNRTIRLPVHITEDVNAMRKAERLYINEHGHEPTNEQLAAAVNKEVSRISDLKDWDKATKLTSLNTPLGDDSAAEFGDILHDDNALQLDELVDRQEMRHALLAAIETLDEREADVIMSRMGFSGQPKTLDELGKKYGVTRERIRQIQSKAMAKLRSARNREALSQFLDG